MTKKMTKTKQNNSKVSETAKTAKTTVQIKKKGGRTIGAK